MYRVGQLLPMEPTLSLPTSATVIEATRAMEQGRVGAVLVHENGQPLAGIFTERDVMIRVLNAGRDPQRTTLGEVMTRGVLTVSPDQRSSEVLRAMQTRHIRHVPVVEDGKPVGMLSLRHILRADLEEKKNEVEAITAYIQGGLGPAPQREEAL
jgi:signal-transduction protein with cAMP-binding, CBS, and nucleotidyltransferase domain